MLNLSANPRGDRRVLRAVKPVSAARMMFALGLTIAAIVLVGLFALYLLGAASGALRSVESFVVSFGVSDAAKYHISFLKILPGFFVLTLFFSGLMAASGALLAVLYNILADLIGGVEIVMGDSRSR